MPTISRPLQRFREHGEQFGSCWDIRNIGGAHCSLIAVYRGDAHAHTCVPQITLPLFDDAAQTLGSIKNGTSVRSIPRYLILVPLVCLP